METRMTKNSPHKRFKGCCLVCGHHLQEGDTRRTPYSALKKTGVKRRFSRNRITKFERDDS